MTYDPNNKPLYPLDQSTVDMTRLHAEDEYEINIEERLENEEINPRFVRWFNEDPANDEPTTGFSAKIRYRACKLCPYFNQTLKICDVCKCFMPIKVQFKNSACPKNKWEE